ncbi:MAG: hypothetical protein ACLUIR_06440 [Faecalibacterium prausnitzii]
MELKRPDGQREEDGGHGDKVLIWPDKMSFDTAAGTLSALGSSWQLGASWLYPCDAAGVVYAEQIRRDRAGKPQNGDVWLKQARMPRGATTP